MPIAFDPPTHAPHGTLPTRGARGVDDDPGTLDIFTQLLLAAAGVQDAAAPLESTSEATPDAAQQQPSDASVLSVPLPLSVTAPLAGGPAATARTVTIVGREKVADVRGSTAADARALLHTKGRDDPLAPAIAAPRDAAAMLRGDVQSDPAATRNAAPVSAAPLAVAAAGQTSLVTEAVTAAAPTHVTAATSSAAATLAALLAPAGEPLDKASAAKPAVELSAAQALAAQQPPPAPAPALHVETISTPAFTPGWQAETVNTLAQIVLTRTERAELRLHPAELGPVNVRIEMRADQATVQIVAASPETRSALEQSLPQLRDLLATQGITLGQASVHDGTAQRDARPDAWTSAPRSGSIDDPAAAPATDTVRVTLRRPDRLVDVFA